MERLSLTKRMSKSITAVSSHGVREKSGNSLYGFLDSCEARANGIHKQVPEGKQIISGSWARNLKLQIVEFRFHEHSEFQ